MVTVMVMVMIMVVMVMIMVVMVVMVMMVMVMIMVMMMKMQLVRMVVLFIVLRFQTSYNCIKEAGTPQQLNTNYSGPFTKYQYIENRNN